MKHSPAPAPVEGIAGLAKHAQLVAFNLKQRTLSHNNTSLITHHTPTGTWVADADCTVGDEWKKSGFNRTSSSRRVVFCASGGTMSANTIIQ